MKALLLLLYILSGSGGVHSQTGDDAKNLRRDLMETDGYDKNILPLTDQSFKIDVYVTFFLLSINELNEVSETLSTTGYLWVAWDDEFLVWDPDDYGGIDYYHWPQEDLWKPDLTLRNSILDYKELGAPNLKLIVDEFGEVSWYPFQVFQSTCGVDITYFPFDIQTCNLTFVIWSYTSAEINLFGGSDGIVLDEYEENSLWEVIGSSQTSEEESGEAIIKFSIKMKRKPLYVILSVIMPLLMLAVLNVFVFILPCESGERAGYAITVFLALAVFLTLIADSLPANSETVAIFAVYVIVQTLLSTLTTLLALWTIRLSTKETEVPRCLVKLANCVQCLTCNRPKRKRRVEKYRQSRRYSDDMVDGDISSEPGYPYVIDRYTGQVSKRSDRSLDRSRDYQSRERSARRNVEESRDASEDEEKVTWSMAVRAIDYVLFLFFFLSLLVSSIVCFVLTATSN